MPFRFRRTASILPGVRVNISKSGPSLTFGRRGIHYTIGRRGNRATVGAPGTGLSYTRYSPRRHIARVRTRMAGQAAGGCLLPMLVVLALITLAASAAIFLG